MIKEIEILSRDIDILIEHRKAASKEQSEEWSRNEELYVAEQ